MRKVLISSLLIGGFLAALPALACTIFSVTGQRGTLIGNNEDYLNSYPEYVWFVPATAKRHGRILFGGKYQAEGGMNDQGLFLDFAVAPVYNPPSWPKKPVQSFARDGHITEEILAQCSTVREAVDFFRRYNLAGSGHQLIADASGASVVIEWVQREMKVVRKQAPYQLVTNFWLANPLLGNFPCPRFTPAADLLDHIGEPSEEKVAAVLHAAAWSQEDAGTQYSNVYDLGAREVVVYYRGDFSRAKRFKLAEELSKGPHLWNLEQLFLGEAYQPPKHAPRNEITLPMMRTAYAKGAQAALDSYAALVAEVDPGSSAEYREQDLNSVGRALMGDGFLEQARAFFEVNVREHPESWSAYESLAEVQMLSGKNQLAIRNCRRSLEINPQNDHGREMLVRLENPNQPRPASEAPDAPPGLFQLPRVEGIQVDGTLDDWAGRGLVIKDLQPWSMARPAAADFDVQFHLGWNAEGLLAAFEVRDDKPVESPEDNRLSKADCLEIMVAQAPGSMNAYKVDIAPGADPRFGHLRTDFRDRRVVDTGLRRVMPLSDDPLVVLYDQVLPRPAMPAKPLIFKAASRPNPGGYTVEVFLPWKNLGLEARPGTEVAFQVFADDRDGDGPSKQLVWYPSVDSWRGTHLMHRLHLVE